MTFLPAAGKGSAPTQGGVMDIGAPGPTGALPLALWLLEVALESPPPGVLDCVVEGTPQGPLHPHNKQSQSGFVRAV